MCRLSLELVRMLPYRAQVIEHPEPTSVGSENQVIAFDDQVVHGCSWQIELQRLPVRTIIVGNEHARFRSGIEEAFSLGILTNRTRKRRRRNARHNLRPSFAEIAGLVDVR